jgi:ribonucleotide reductase alpha subunit
MEYTSPEEVAVCNLASISLPKFVDADRTFNYAALERVTKVITKNLNKVIDENFYPVEEARNSNMKHRPVGIGVQGLADALMKMKIPFESDDALAINEKIFETIYFAALTSSMEIAKIQGPYQSYQGSPISQGLLQFDLWGKKPSTKFDWDGLRAQINTHGVRNSLLISPMPTASTSQILGNNECFEPYTSNIYIRRVLSGEFVIINPHLVNDLIELVRININN